MGECVSEEEGREAIDYNGGVEEGRDNLWKSSEWTAEGVDDREGREDLRSKEGSEDDEEHRQN